MGTYVHKEGGVSCFNTRAHTLTQAGQTLTFPDDLLPLQSLVVLSQVVQALVNVQSITYVCNLHIFQITLVKALYPDGEGEGEGGRGRDDEKHGDIKDTPGTTTTLNKAGNVRRYRSIATAEAVVGGLTYMENREGHLSGENEK